MEEEEESTPNTSLIYYLLKSLSKGNRRKIISLSNGISDATIKHEAFCHQDIVMVHS